ADDAGIVPGRDVVDVVDPELARLVGLHFHAEATPEDDALMVHLAPASAGDRTDVPRPAPARLQHEPTDRALAMGDGLDPPVGKAADLVRTAKALGLGTRHGLPP